MSAAELDLAKRAARAAAVARRGHHGAEAAEAAGEALARHVLADMAPPPGAVVSGFWPLPGEMDLRPLLRALHARGHLIALPLTPPRGHPLRFHRWYPGCPMLRERFGTERPDGTEELVPDVLFVPLLAFDRAGRRLGYGGGYYDRTLAGLPGRPAIGCAFAAQEMAAVPAGAHDVRLDAVATEAGVMRTSRAAGGDAGPPDGTDGSRSSVGATRGDLEA